MKFEWDGVKEQANLAKHGLSLTDAERFEMEEAFVELDDRMEYGEDRYRAFGRMDGEGHALIFTYRDNAIRIISFRRAHEKEMRRYGL